MEEVITAQRDCSQNGIDYILYMRAQADILSIKLVQKYDTSFWHNKFTAAYIEELTQNIGNRKNFGDFVSILASAIKSPNLAQFNINILTYQDLEDMKARKAGQQPQPLPQQQSGSLNNSSSSTSNIASINKRYLMLSCMSQLEKVHYPLSLNYEENVDQDNLNFRKNIMRENNDKQEQRSAATFQSENKAAAEQPAFKNRKRTAEEYDRFYARESAETPNTPYSLQKNKAIKKEPSKEQKINQLQRITGEGFDKCLELLLKNDWCVNLAAVTYCIEIKKDKKDDTDEGEEEDSLNQYQENSRNNQESELNSKEKAQILVSLTQCIQEEAEKALEEAEGDFANAEKIIEASRKKPQSSNKIFSQSNDKQTKRSLALLRTTTQCTLREAQDALAESDGDFAKAEKLLEVAKIRNSEDNFNTIMPFGGDPKRMQTAIRQRPASSHELAQLNQEVETLQIVVECSHQTALEALQILKDFTTAENFLRQAIRFCRGDEEQALRLIKDNPLELGALNSLTACQHQALNFIAEMARVSHLKSYPLLKKRFQDLKHQDHVLDCVLKYIRDDAPIIIHFNCNQVLEKFALDTHYRNTFETSTHSQEYTVRRRNWESKLFDQHYDHCTPFERPKYGVLNISGALQGVANCHSYGLCYLVLREVRLRTTFVAQDSSYVVSKSDFVDQVATCQYYGNILMQFNDRELRDVVDIATGKFPLGKLSDGFISKREEKIRGAYKEVQIHGEVSLNKHVQTLCCRRREWTGDAQKLEDLLVQFSQKHPNVEVVQID